MARAGRNATGTGATERRLPIQFFALAEEGIRDETIQAPPSPILPFAELNHVLGQLCAMCDCLATNQGFEAGEKNFQLKYMNFWSRV